MDVVVVRGGRAVLDVGSAQALVQTSRDEMDVLGKASTAGGEGTSVASASVRDHLGSRTQP